MGLTKILALLYDPVPLLPTPHKLPYSRSRNELRPSRVPHGVLTKEGERGERIPAEAPSAEVGVRAGAGGQILERHQVEGCVEMGWSDKSRCWMSVGRKSVKRGGSCSINARRAQLDAFAADSNQLTHVSTEAAVGIQAQYTFTGEIYLPLELSLSKVKKSRKASALKRSCWQQQLSSDLSSLLNR